MLKKVCHMTSAHYWNDDRIWLKECQALADDGYDVYLVSEGIDREEKGVHIVGCGERPKSRKERMRGFAKKIYEQALKLNCDVYHFHDPELLPYGVKLKKMGKRVIFDSHEDVPGQILDKDWLPFPVRKLVSVVYKLYETRCVKQFDAVVTATPHIAEKFKGRCSRVAVVNNYPKLDDIKYHDAPFNQREPIVCYAGGISESRGEKIMLDAMKGVSGCLILAGEHDVVSLCDGAIKYIGFVGRDEVNKLYGEAVAGLCILKPTPNYYYSKPIKMYEYMAAGLPFICSDFPSWKDVVRESGAGICVNPENIQEIQRAISLLLDDRKLAQEMGRKGREWVVQNCAWENEKNCLIELYKALDV